MYFNIEDAAKRLNFLTASESVLPEGETEALGLNSKPKFIIWKGGKKEAIIDGMKINEIEDRLMDLLPALDD